jgi:glycosyltransferase involved in cell wall biosynthesis
MDASKSNGGPILMVVPSLGPNGAAKQVSLLAPALARKGQTVQVAALGGEGMFAHVLRGDGVPVRLLGPRWRFELGTMLKLRRLVDELKPASIHAWRGAAARLLSTLGRLCRLPPLIAVDPFVEQSPSRFNRRCLRRAEKVVVSGPWQRQQTAQAGIGEDRLRVIPPCVSAPTMPERATALRDLAIPENARLIVCAGAIEPGRGFREAAWVLDILSYVYPDLWLLAIGDGSQREQVARFAWHGGKTAPRIRFAGWRRDAAALLGLAEVVWVLGKRGGRNVALEALAAGRPVVARDRPDLREILTDGETGYLVDRASPQETARATRRILDDATRRQTFAANALRRAEQFQLEAVVGQWVVLLDLSVDPWRPSANHLP